MSTTPEMFNTNSESVLTRLPLAAENSAAAASPFATVEDLEKRWHALTQEERERAKILLSDASEIIIYVCGFTKMTFSPFIFTSP